jgi:GntR family histidine utilization transcriptional repressor
MTDAAGFRDVKAEILRRITRGPWGPGSLLPGEVRLAAEFGCSRATVNRALRELHEAGLLDRRRKSGTRVRQAPIRQARFEMPVVRTEIERQGAAYSYRLIRQEISPAPAWLRDRLALAPVAKMVFVTCVHHADGLPFQLEERWINAEALPEVLTHDFSGAGPNEWLIATVPYSEVEVSFLAGAANEAETLHLGFRPGEPVFRMERMTRWQGAPITHVTMSYRRDFRLTARY